MIHRKFTMYAWGILTHGEIHARGEFLSVGPHLHLSGEGVDVDGERLADDLIHARLFELLLQILPSFVGAILGIAATLVFRGTQFLDNLFVMRQILRVQLHGD